VSCLPRVKPNLLVIKIRRREKGNWIYLQYKRNGVVSVNRRCKTTLDDAKFLHTKQYLIHAAIIEKFVNLPGLEYKNILNQFSLSCAFHAVSKLAALAQARVTISSPKQPEQLVM
jgi:hypothetical protein